MSRATAPTDQEDIIVGYRGQIRQQYVSVSTASTYAFYGTIQPNQRYERYEPVYKVVEEQCKGCGARSWMGNQCKYCKGTR